MRANLLIILLLVTLVTNVYAIEEDSELLTETYKVGIPINLPFSCTINGGLPSTSVTLNITLQDKNGNYLLENVQTTSLGNGAFYYNYTFENIGLHKVTIFCFDGLNNGSSEGYYNLNPTGEELNGGKATMYILAFVISILVLLGLLFTSSSIEGNNKTDQMSGYILAVSNLKYLKMFLLAVSYIITVFIFYFAWMITYSFLNMEFVSTVLQFFFYFLAYSTFPLFILYVYLNIANLVRDNKIGDALSRGLRIRE